MKNLNKYIQENFKKLMNEQIQDNEPMDEKGLYGELESYSINYETNTFDCKIHNWKGDDIEIQFETVIEKLYKIIPDFFYNIEKMFPESNDVYGDAVRFLEGQNYNFTNVLNAIFKERADNGLEPNGLEKQDEFDRELDENADLYESKNKTKKTIRGFFLDLLKQGDVNNTNDVDNADNDKLGPYLDDSNMNDLDENFNKLPEEGDYLIYKTDIEGHTPKHDVVDSASTKKEAEDKVRTLEVLDPDGIYYFDLNQSVQSKFGMN